MGPAGEIDDPSAPKDFDGIEVVAILRSRRDRPSALVALADGRYALLTETVAAVGDRRSLAQLVRAAGDAIGERPRRARLVAGDDRRPE